MWKSSTVFHLPVQNNSIHICFPQLTLSRHLNLGFQGFVYADKCWFIGHTKRRRILDEDNEDADGDAKRDENKRVKRQRILDDDEDDAADDAEHSETPVKRRRTKRQRIVDDDEDYADDTEHNEKPVVKFRRTRAPGTSFTNDLLLFSGHWDGHNRTS